MKTVAFICSLLFTTALAGTRTELEPRPTAGLSATKTCESKVSVGSKEVAHGKCKQLKGFVHPKDSSESSLVDRKSKQ